jgi:hypothetical protein
VFYLGSYSFRSNVGTLGYNNGGGCHTRVGHGVSLLPHASHTALSMSVWRRNFTCFPSMLGNVAYVLLARGARTHSHGGPITMPADIGLSHWPEQRDGRAFTCRSPDGTDANQAGAVPQAAYAPTKWIVWPGTTGPPASALPKHMLAQFGGRLLKGGTHIVDSHSHTHRYNKTG